MSEKCEVGAQYVVGFMFSADLRFVLLVLKNRPDWQRGKLNGIGGKIEDDESPDQAMRREFLEEAAIDTDDWLRFATLGDDRGWIIHFYYAKGDINKAKTVTDEILMAIPLWNLNREPRLIPNLTWLIPMALSMQKERIDYFQVTEQRIYETQSNEASQ